MKKIKNNRAGGVCFLFILAIVIHFEVEIYSQKAVRFEAPGDYIEVPHSSSLALGEFTIEFWLKVNGLGDPEMAGGEQTILDKRGGDGGFNFRLAGTNFPLPVFAFVIPGDVFAVDVIQRELWNHLAITQDSDSLKMYFNGELADQKKNSYASNTMADLRIGEFLGYPGAYLGLQGEIDDLRIWDHARSQDSIQYSMHDFLAGTENGLAAYWDFEAFVNDTLPDKTPNGNDGFIFGNARLVDSEAPVGFIPPVPPVGLRAFGGEQSIDLAWKSLSEAITSHRIYRGDSLDFPVDTTNLIATVDAPDSTFKDTGVVPGKDYYYCLRAAEGEHLSQRSSTCLRRINSISEGYMTGVAYYPWYGEDEGLHQWPWAYMRYFLVPQQPPLLGQYSSRDSMVIRQHLDWMQSSGIDFLVSSWWGRNSFENVTIRDHLLPEIEKSGIKFALYYESALLGIDQGQISIDDTSEVELLADFNYMADTYFDSPSLLRINGKPVVFIYLSRIYAGSYLEAFSRIRNELSAKGYELFLVGDEVGWETPSAEHMQFLDAVSPYILLPDQNRHKDYALNGSFFADVSLQVGEWERIAGARDIVVIPNVNPGFNNHSGGGNRGSAFPRQSYPGEESTSMLEDYIKVVRPFVNPQHNLIMITSWNEWHEDSQIEPTIITDSTSLDVSPSGNKYTMGFSYEGYGFKNLELIRSLLASELPPLGINPPGENTPPEIISFQHYPNPVTSSATITYGLQKSGNVSLKIYDLLGKEVQTLVDEFQTPTTYTVQFDTRDLSSGSYYYRLNVNNHFSQTLKMIVLH